MELCSLPAICLGPNYGGGNEDNGNLLQKVPSMHCCTQCPRPCSRPLPTHASARDSWTLTGKSGSVSCGVTAPFSQVLVRTSFWLCLFPQSPEQYEKTTRTLKDELPGSVGAQYATGEEWRTNSRKNEGMEPKQKRHPVVDGTGDGSRVWCC